MTAKERKMAQAKAAKAKKHQHEMQQVAWERGHNQGLDEGCAMGIDQGKRDARKELEAEGRQKVLEANVKLAQALGQMVEGVARAVIAFVGDNGLGGVPGGERGEGRR